MTINEKLITLLEPIGCPVVPHLYTGEDARYMTFDYAATLQLYGDNSYEAFSYTVQLHYFFPAADNPFADVRAVLDLLDADDTFELVRVEGTADLQEQYYLFTLSCVGGPEYGEV